jgi:hypothetical protein
MHTLSLQLPPPCSRCKNLHCNASPIHTMHTMLCVVKMPPHSWGIGDGFVCRSRGRERAVSRLREGGGVAPAASFFISNRVRFRWKSEIMGAHVGLVFLSDE